LGLASDHRAAGISAIVSWELPLGGNKVVNNRQELRRRV
jgi:hypothetical protein